VAVIDPVDVVHPQVALVESVTISELEVTVDVSFSSDSIGPKPEEMPVKLEPVIKGKRPQSPTVEVIGQSTVVVDGPGTDSLASGVDSESPGKPPVPKLDLKKTEP
jgi:hypothetical protein